MILSAPTVINLEITDVCNAKCGHCYNFWREEGSSYNVLSRDKFDRLVEIFTEAKVFHVVLTGGEPLTNFEVLEYGLKKLLDNNISVSCNSNLMLATDDKLRRLRDAGLDHILTSLNSFDPATNDRLVNREGAFGKIISGIELALRHDIRISVNMIVSQINKDHVYDTGKLVARLGCQRLFGTRVVPSVNTRDINETMFKLEEENIRHTVEQLVRVKEETGIMIGTLVSYPLCALGDLVRYIDFVGRGCPGQSGHLMSINATGSTHPCVHESEEHGNIFEIGIYEAHRNMRSWHDTTYRFKGCEGCRYLDICNSGCRMASHAHFGKYDQMDPLMKDKESFKKHFEFIEDKSVIERIRRGSTFIVPKRLRFRKEEGFYLLNIRWANTIVVSDDTAEFLVRYRQSGDTFTVEEFGRDKLEELAKLYLKDAVESSSIQSNKAKQYAGMSVDPSVLK